MATLYLTQAWLYIASIIPISLDILLVSENEHACVYRST